MGAGYWYGYGTLSGSCEHLETRSQPLLQQSQNPLLYLLPGFGIFGFCFLKGCSENTRLVIFKRGLGGLGQQVLLVYYWGVKLG